ncbi:hypothetical protein A1O3_08371 [Capronia epimyces CBS 606.96]|uniref:Uncharacterized protein n=1 Tax=Capronia epimyces CBS 606.96 TaxID=1182542 RepID=W9XRX5_9EURO|nr:uncharacterized protein A1O3_08371 [Capronia epimyces CBS 606.96]EXJ80085.1 hypothetical protein A1O3_08371 [Capronia epimyces CBS 606.96]
MAAPEIKRGDFLYRDTLFVDLGETKRHPRASASELKQLLLPKKGSAPVKDQVGHWYEAQLLHYGLPRTKDKNVAKVRLTTAVVSGALAVPTHISKMEADMKKEYVASVRKAKAAAGVTQASKAADTPVTKGKKRKASDRDTNAATTISLKIGDISLEVGIPVAANQKKQKPSPAEPKEKVTSAAKGKAALRPKPAEPGSVKPKPADKVSTSKKTSKAQPSTAQPVLGTGSPSRTASANAGSRPKQTARRGKPFLQSPATRNPLRSSQPVIRDHSSSSDLDMDDAPPPYDSHDFSHASTPPRNRASVQVSGLYHVQAPQLQASCSLALKIDHASGQLWGNFRFGTKSGVLRMDELAGVAEGQPTSFAWRSKDDKTGQLKFGRGCDGSIEFDGNEGVKGRFFGLMYGGDLEFEGSLTDMNDVPNVDWLRDEWDEFPRIAYGRD